MPNRRGSLVNLAFCAPYALLTWLVGLLSLVVGIAHKPERRGSILVLEFREWFARGRDGEGWWRFSTTIGRTIWFQPGRRSEAGWLDERIEKHEVEHVYQVEDLMLLSFVVGLAVAIGWWAHGEAAAGFWWWFGIWTSGGLWQLPNFVTAGFRYGWANAYRDSSHERQAYGVSDLAPIAGRSWYDLRNEAREKAAAQALISIAPPPARTVEE